MKLLFWKSVPTHHQSSLFAAARKAGVDLRVGYFERDLPAEYVENGWPRLPPAEGEEFYADLATAMQRVSDWRDRIHIVPGYGSPFTRELVQALASSDVRWVHLSEPARPGWRWLASFARKRWYANRVNRTALGALAMGAMAERDFIRWGIRADRIAFLPYTVPPVATDGTPDSVCAEFCGGRPAFIFVGRRSWRKGTDVLLAAYARLPRSDSNWPLLLVGADDCGCRNRSAYSRLANQLGIADKVLFRDAIAADLLGSVLRCARVLVLPSRFDGWGVPLNEGASAGLALIATDRVGSAYHLLEPGENGFRARAGDVASLAGCLAAYVWQPTLAGPHGRRSLQLFEQFTPERTAQRLVSVLESWLAREGGAHER